jgi:hypothetical protein
MKEGERMTLDNEFNYHTSWSRVLEKLAGSQLVKKFTAFYVSHRFITAFTSACHYPDPDQSTPLPKLHNYIYYILYL